MSNFQKTKETHRIQSLFFLASRKNRLGSFPICKSSCGASLIFERFGKKWDARVQISTKCLLLRKIFLLFLEKLLPKLNRSKQHHQKVVMLHCKQNRVLKRMIKKHILWKFLFWAWVFGFPWNDFAGLEAALVLTLFTVCDDIKEAGVFSSQIKSRQQLYHFVAISWFELLLSEEEFF